MKQEVLAAHRATVWYLDELLRDVPEESVTKQPEGLKNHALWIVGHLAVSADRNPLVATQPPLCPPEWTPLFGRESQPKDDPTAYPPLAEVRAKLTEVHKRLTDAVLAADEKSLDVPNPHPMLSSVVPTMGGMVIFGLLGHESIHLGQLTCWRRAMGFAPRF